MPALHLESVNLALLELDDVPDPVVLLVRVEANEFLRRELGQVEVEPTLGRVQSM